MQDSPAADPAGTGPREVGRLRKRREFLAVARGERAVMPNLILQVLPRGGDGPRVGFTVSRKVGNAVERNRTRRRLKEAARMLGPRLAASGHDYVIIGRRAALKAPYTSIVKDLERAFKRAHKRTGAAARDTSDA